MPPLVVSVASGASSDSVIGLAPVVERRTQTTSVGIIGMNDDIDDHLGGSSVAMMDPLETFPDDLGSYEPSLNAASDFSWVENLEHSPITARPGASVVAKAGIHQSQPRTWPLQSVSDHHKSGSFSPRAVHVPS